MKNKSHPFDQNQLSKYILYYGPEEIIIFVIIFVNIILMEFNKTMVMFLLIDNECVSPCSSTNF